MSTLSIFVLMLVLGTQRCGSVPTRLQGGSLLLADHGLLLSHVDQIDLSSSTFHYVLAFELPSIVNFEQIPLDCQGLANDSEIIRDQLYIPCVNINHMMETSHNFVGTLSGRLGTMLNDIIIINPPNATNTDLKRSIFSAIGGGLAAIFGIATSSDISTLQKNIKVMVKNDHTIASHVEDLEHTMGKMVNRTSVAISQLTETMAANQHETLRSIEALTLYAKASIAAATKDIDRLEIVLHCTQYFSTSLITNNQKNAELMGRINAEMELWGLVISQLMDSKLPLELIGPAYLSTVLDSVAQRLSQLPSTRGMEITHSKDITYFYKNKVITSQVHDGVLYIQLNIQISRPSAQMFLYHVNTWPVFVNGDSNVASVLSNVPDLYAISHDFSLEAELGLGVLSMCDRSSPRRCPAVPIKVNNVGEMSCLGSLIKGVDSPASCKHKVNPNYTETYVSSVNGHYILVDPGHDAILNCIDDNSRHILPRSGLLTVPCSCSLVSRENLVEVHSSSLCDVDNLSPTIHPSYAFPFLKEFLEIPAVQFPRFKNNFTMDKAPELPKYLPYKKIATDFSHDMGSIAEHLRDNNGWPLEEVDVYGSWFRSNAAAVVGLILVVVVGTVVVIMVFKYYKQGKYLVKFGNALVRLGKGGQNKTMNI